MRKPAQTDSARKHGCASNPRIAPAWWWIVAVALVPAHAAEPPYGTEATALEVMVVTATRSALSLAEVPAAVTVVDERQIEAKPVSRLGDALDQVPSLYLQNGAFGASQGTSGTSNLSLRGVDQSKVLILLDGQPIQDASSGKVNWRIPFMADIERIEVVPGAFSSLYGSNAIGGVINLITKQPDTREFTLKLSKGWQDLSGEDASVYFRDKWDNGLGIVVGAGYQNRDSYVNDFVVKTPVAGVPGTPVTGWIPTTTREGAPAYLIGDKGRTPWTSAHALIKLSYAFNARDKLTGGVSWQETNQDYTPYTTYLLDALGNPVASGAVDVDGNRVNLSLADYVNNSPLQEGATRYFLNYEGTLSAGYLLKVDLARIERVYSFSTPDSGAAATYEGGPGRLTDTPNSGLDGSMQISFPSGDKHFWVAGFAFHQDEANQKVYTLSNWRSPGSQTGVVSAYNGKSGTLSLFAQDEITVTDTLTAYLGGRLDHWSTEGDYFDTTPTTKFFANRSETAFSPKASAVYRPVDAATVRASFGRSFRAPTNLDLYSISKVGPLTIYNNPNLVPETGSTWELGGEWRFSAASKAGVTIYESNLKNLIYTKRVGFNIDRLNAGKARIRGIELSGSTRLTRWLKLDTNYAWIDSEILENAVDPQSVGKRLTNSPEHIAGIQLTAQQGPWTGTLGARYVSHVYFNSNNTDVVEGVPGSYDAYTMVNAKVGYAFSKTVKGSLRVHNLFDEEAYSFFLLPRCSAVAELAFNF